MLIDKNITAYCGFLEDMPVIFAYTWERTGITMRSKMDRIYIIEDDENIRNLIKNSAGRLWL